MTERATSAKAGVSLVLATLAASQFLMTLDTSVMNVSIATVAEDLGTSVTGVQTAITLYTLVMASLMITGGKIGAIIGSRKAFQIGCVVYGVGSLTTSLAPNLAVLILGWSVLEGLGAVLILPAIVTLVAANFEAEQRPRTYGLIASAGAVAVAVGPLIGGACTTYFSWRWVFAGEVVLVVGILALARRVNDIELGHRPKLDLVGTALSAAGLGLFVFGVLRSGVWGWVEPKPGGPDLLGLSPVIWLILGGALVLWAFFGWEARVIARGGEPLFDPALLRISELRAGLVMFQFQYLLQSGLFFAVPLFLSVALGLSALQTGARLVPLSISLLVAAAGIPRVFPNASPRTVVRFGILGLLAGIVSLMAALEVGADAGIVTVPMLLAGLGIGALASQLGAVTVSAVPDEQAGEVGGVQNTFVNLGASLGTALAGAVLIGSLTTAFLTGIDQNPAVPDATVEQANVLLADGAPFISDADLESALQEAGVPPDVAAAILEQNEDARITALRASLGVLAVIALVPLFCVGGIPDRQPAPEPAAF